MELLERYLYAVSKHLPQARREDLIAELKDNLLSQLEDEAASLGRPASRMKRPGCGTTATPRSRKPGMQSM